MLMNYGFERYYYLKHTQNAIIWRGLGLSRSSFVPNSSLLYSDNVYIFFAIVLSRELLFIVYIVGLYHSSFCGGGKSEKRETTKP